MPFARDAVLTATAAAALSSCGFALDALAGPPGSGLTCEDLEQEALAMSAEEKESTEGSWKAELREVEDLEMTTDHRDEVEVPDEGDDRAVILVCEGKAKWDLGFLDGPIEITATLDSDEEVWIGYQGE
ncbi:hypothetical protein [Nocardioides solisilvae]|uniref:hypothetical protein n=1 Tax=Nocardioides solisilvae TaxID=1542435 RepID=UPI000D742AF7|nr:hypothetical protein [Nocardioides solisilvae]